MIQVVIFRTFPICIKQLCDSTFESVKAREAGDESSSAESVLRAAGAHFAIAQNTSSHRHYIPRIKMQKRKFHVSRFRERCPAAPHIRLTKHTHSARIKFEKARL
jgi:hypothetical protein